MKAISSLGVRSPCFYGTKYEIWADFGPIGNTEKKIWAVKYATFDGVFFHLFSTAKFVLLYKSIDVCKSK